MKSKLHFVLSLSLLLGFCLIEAKAQSPRLQLLEYFDNTSIPPFGAVANANVDSLITNYSNKITCIKYHVAWGSQTGTDPMNLHNPVQPQTRVNYYKITADPHAMQDGAVKADSTFNGQPSGFTAAMINKRNAVTSPFTVKVTHTLNTAKDSIFTRTVVTKTGTVTATGPLVAHVVVIEKLVRFFTPPGVSGDKDFHNVMKRMLPSDTGSVLPAMNIGDSVVFNLNWKLANVYDANQLCAISFVQGKDSTNREVYQAGQSFPAPLALDAGIKAIANNSFNCDSINQKVILKNFGLNTLTSCDIVYKVGAGAPATYPWTGSLITGATTTVTIKLTGLTGHHTLKLYPSNPNGGADMSSYNDTVLTNITMSSVPTAGPVTEGFQGAFIPANWAIGNPDMGLAWSKDSLAGGFGASNRSTRIDFYQMPDTTQTDDLYAPKLNLSAVNGKYYCHFDLAYSDYLPLPTDSLKYFDTLQVRVSTNCGATWTTLYSKTGSALQTTPAQQNPFVPTASQWRHEIVDLSSFAGQADVQIQFHAMNGWGNNLYLDNINTTASGLTAATSATVITTGLPCDSVDVMVSLKNSGLDTITSCTLNYKIGTSAPVSMPWTGNLLPGNSTNIPLHFTGLNGLQTVKIYSSAPNGSVDVATTDDTTKLSIFLAPTPVSAPLAQGFQSATFPPTNWTVVNPDKSVSWSQGLVGGFAWSNRSAKIDFYNDSVGQIEDLYAPNLDLSSDTGKIYCTFSVAYAKRNATALDTFQVQVSKDCGTTWATLYSKSDTLLQTTTLLYPLPFTPNAAKWRAEAVDLTSYIGEANVMIRFRGLSRRGNNLWLDDINISHSATGVSSISSISELSYYPNPSNGIVNLSIQLMKEQDLRVSVMNILGETITENNYGKTSGGKYVVDLSAQPSGIYFMRITSGGDTETRKVIVNK